MREEQIWVSGWPFKGKTCQGTRDGDGFRGRQVLFSETALWDVGNSERQGGGRSQCETKGRVLAVDEDQLQLAGRGANLGEDVAAEARSAEAVSVRLPAPAGAFRHGTIGQHQVVRPAMSTQDR